MDFFEKFSTESCSCGIAVPNKELRLSPILSSIIIAETPNRSRVFTLNLK